MTTPLTVERLSFAWPNGRPALRHCNLQIPRPGLWMLVGTNGSGKSTLSKVLAGHPAYTVTAGTVTYRGQNLLELSPEERAEIAFVMDMQDFSTAKKDMRNNGLDLQVVYHSHPHDPARPSVTDIKIATDYEEIWPKINLPIPAYLLISLMHATPDIRSYWIKSGEVSAAPFTVR